MIKQSFCLAVTFLLLTTASFSADPEQVGDYAGTIKSKVYTGTTKTSVKSEFLLSIAADDSTTVTIGGVDAKSEAAFKGATGILFFINDETTDSSTLAALEFKNGRFKGTSIGIVEGPPIKTIESKITLKKVVP